MEHLFCNSQLLKQIPADGGHPDVFLPPGCTGKARYDQKREKPRDQHDSKCLAGSNDNHVTSNPTPGSGCEHIRTKLIDEVDRPRPTRRPLSVCGAGERELGLNEAEWH